MRASWAVSVIASILILGIGSMYSVYSVGSPTVPEIEKIMFIDRYMPTDVALAGDPFPCDQTTDKFKTISGGVHWQEFPVTYSINTANFDTSLSTTVSKAAAKDAVKRAFDTWDLEDHGGDENKDFFSLVNNNAKITVEWKSLDGEGGTLGITTTHFNPKLKKIVAAEIVFDKDDRWNNFILKCEAQGTGGDNVLDFDLEDVAAHEVGHAIGLGHVNGFDDRFNTEYVSIIAEGETHKQTLGLGDKTGLASLHGDVDGDNGNGGPDCNKSKSKKWCP